MTWITEWYVLVALFLVGVLVGSALFSLGYQVTMKPWNVERRNVQVGRKKQTPSKIAWLVKQTWD